MKNKKGFTLIELLAVIIILGVIMTIAIPNVVATLDKNKRDSFIQDAKRVISSAEYTIRSNTRIDYPDDYSITVLPLKDIKNLELGTSSFDTYYSTDKSFVAIVKENTSTADQEYAYYVHLVSCTDELCENTEDDSISYNRGINLTKASDLDKSDRYDLVVKGAEVKLDYLLDTNYNDLKSAFSNKTNVNIY